MQEWLMRVCVKRGIKSGVIALTSFLGSLGVAKVLEAHGVTVDWGKFQVEMTASLCAGLEMLHDYLKVKKGISWL